MRPGSPGTSCAYLVEKGDGNPAVSGRIDAYAASPRLLSAEVDLNQVALDALNLPNSVQGLLLAQIDRLAVEARHTLQMASVIGKTFLYRVLAALDQRGAALDASIGHTRSRRAIF